MKQQYIKNLQSDIPAAIVVFLVAIPLCLGIAIASGVSEFSGLVAGIIGGVVVGFLSGSQLSVSGPAAGLTAIVVAAVSQLPGVEAFFLAVVLAGVLQLLMGVLKLGVIGHYIPNSVIKGLLAAIGIILIINQIPSLFGIGSGKYPTFEELSSGAHTINTLAMIIGLTGIGILVLFETKWIKSKKIFSIINGPLVVVLAGVGLYLLAGNGSALTTQHLINIPVTKSLQEFTGLFQHPDFSFIGNGSVWMVAITLALVASLETLLGIEAVDKIDPQKRITPNNRELLAQGSGNIISGLLGGLPITSVIVRSSANMQAGAKTKSSAIIHGLLIFVCVAFFPVVLNLIPKAALAAILIFTGYKLAKIPLFKEHYKKGWDQFIPFVVTTVAVVTTDLLTGVMIGLVTAIFYILRDNFRTSIFMVKDGSNYMIRLRKDVSFFSKPNLKKKLENIPENSKLLIDISKAEYVDRDVMDTIQEFMQQAKSRNIVVQLNGKEFNGSRLKRTSIKINRFKYNRKKEIATETILLK
jgi:MFS superfamily sulfate permease-like transporter